MKSVAPREVTVRFRLSRARLDGALVHPGSGQVRI